MIKIDSIRNNVEIINSTIFTRCFLYKKLFILQIIIFRKNKKTKMRHTCSGFSLYLSSSNKNIYLCMQLTTISTPG